MLAPGLRAGRDPRDVPGPRDRRQAPERPRRLRGDGARRDARRRAHRRRAARRDAGPAGDVVVVDVGGATTDVHSVVELDPEDADAGAARSSRPPRSPAPSRATSGMRWSAVTTVEPAWRPACSRPTRRWTARPGCGTTTRRYLPADRRPTRDDEAHRAAADGARRCAGTPGGRASCSAPTGPGRRAHRQGPARGRPAGRLGRGAAPRAPGVAERILRRWSAPTSRGLAAARAARAGRRPRLRPRRGRPARRSAPRGGVHAGAATLPPGRARGSGTPTA